jgi:hypothetical protein
MNKNRSNDTDDSSINDISNASEITNERKARENKEKLGRVKCGGK